MYNCNVYNMVYTSHLSYSQLYSYTIYILPQQKYMYLFKIIIVWWFRNSSFTNHSHNMTSISPACPCCRKGHRSPLWFYHRRPTRSRFPRQRPRFEPCPARWPLERCRLGTSRSARPLCNYSWIIWLGLDCRRNTFDL